MSAQINSRITGFRRSSSPQRRSAVAVVIALVVTVFTVQNAVAAPAPVQPGVRFVHKDADVQMIATHFPKNAVMGLTATFTPYIGTVSQPGTQQRFTQTSSTSGDFSQDLTLPSKYWKGVLVVNATGGKVNVTRTLRFDMPYVGPKTTATTIKTTPTSTKPSAPTTSTTIKVTTTSTTTAPTTTSTTTVVTLPPVTAPTSPTPANGFTTNLTSYGAKCDGTTDDRAALTSAVKAVNDNGGGTITVPAANCRILLTANHNLIQLSGSTTIMGTSSASTLSLDTDSASSFRELFRVTGANNSLQNLNLVRVSAVYGQMIDVEKSTKFTMTNVTMDGQSTVYPVAGGFQGINLGGGSGDVLQNISLINSTIKGMHYGLLQDSSITSTLNGFTVNNSTFTSNSGDDLEFNAPKGTMTNVTVTNSKFSNNLSTATSSGIGVGMANVQNGLIQNNSFEGYQLDPVHIEDRSAFISVDRNHFVNTFTSARSYASDVFIISTSHDISVTNNVFDTSQNTNSFACVFAETGGAKTAPNNVTISGNTFMLRPNTRAVTDTGAHNVTIGANTTIVLP